MNWDLADLKWLRFNVLCQPAPPRLEKELRDQKVDAGDQFKVKLPFSGTGPFDIKVKKDGKEVKESNRIKISPFDDFVTFVIKGTKSVSSIPA